MGYVSNILESGWRLMDYLTNMEGESEAVEKDERRLADEMRKIQMKRFSGRSEGYYSTDIGEQKQDTYEAARQTQDTLEALGQEADVGQDMYALTKAAKTKAFGEQ